MLPGETTICNFVSFHPSVLMFWFLFFIRRFGVCCVFIVTAGTSTISQNCTYVQNPNFPSGLPNTNSVQYTVQRCNDGWPCIFYTFLNKAQNLALFFSSFSTDVCTLRLDFERFSIQGVGGTAQANEGVCSMDTFTVTVSASVGRKPKFLPVENFPF